MFPLEIVISLETKPENLGKSGTPSLNAMVRIYSSSPSLPRKAGMLFARSTVALENSIKSIKTHLSMSPSTPTAKSLPSERKKPTTLRQSIYSDQQQKKGKRVADIESVDDARNTILQKPRIHVLDHQQQHIMGFDGLVDIVSRVENQLQHLHLQPLSNNGLGFGYFESFSYEDEQDFGIYLMATDSDSISTSNAAPPSASTFNPEENSRSIEFMSDEKDVGAASALDHDFCLQVLDLSGCYDEADGFPATKATAQASAYWT
ncbi:hypothetical protein NC652_037635 [Populus alba x Populus x berolinensis]|nr:hypothetical protein NC652_037635 [Populus alba x Populus x berolinensis]